MALTANSKISPSPFSLKVIQYAHEKQTGVPNMEHAMIFHVLGIQETSDEAVIKSAYLRLLKTTNPEDDPDGFKRIFC